MDFRKLKEKLPSFPNRQKEGEAASYEQLGFGSPLSPTISASVIPSTALPTVSPYAEKTERCSAKPRNESTLTPQF